MKLPALLILFILSISFQAFSQKKFIGIAGTAKIDEHTRMKIAEVNIQEWMMFIANNNFDSTLFPKIDLLPSPVQWLFLDLKKGHDFDYLKISKPQDYRELRKIKEVSQTKKFHQDSKEESKGLMLHSPITAITYAQAKRYCFWLESRINGNGQTQVKIDLPSDAVYKMVITNLDSLNHQGCALFNFIKCQCISATKKNYNELLGKSLVWANAYFPTELGLYNLQGNAAEMTNIEGKAMGGSFRHYARDSYSDRTQHYLDPEDWLGFRFVITWN